MLGREVGRLWSSFIPTNFCLFFFFTATFQMPKSIEVDRLLKHTKAFNEGLMDHVDWLDRMTFSCAEKVKKEVFEHLRFLARKFSLFSCKNLNFWIF